MEDKKYVCPEADIVKYSDEDMLVESNTTPTEEYESPRV